MREDEPAFLTRRAEEEAERACCATCPEAARVHERLAVAYRERLADYLRSGGTRP